MRSQPTFLELPGEIRNQIYLQVALDAPLIRLFEGRVVLPALANVCRKTRKEMGSKYRDDATLNTATPIHALVTNFNFHPLSRWLDKHSSDLKDRLDTPRPLCITSVLLFPDGAADCSTRQKLQGAGIAPSSTASRTFAGDAPGPNIDTKPPANLSKTKIVKLKIVPEALLRCVSKSTTLAREAPSSSLRNAGREAHSRTTSNVYKNTLCSLERNVEAWSRTWTSCNYHHTPYPMRRTNPRHANWPTTFASTGGTNATSLVAERSGTRYATAWKTRTIHRQHPIPDSEPVGIERTGTCYRGDFCHHLVFNHLAEIVLRADRSTRPDESKFIRHLVHAMITSHNKSAHIHCDCSQHTRASRGKASSPDDPYYKVSKLKEHPAGSQALLVHGIQMTRGEEKVVKFYQLLDRYNIHKRMFELDLEFYWNYDQWMNNDLCCASEQGTKRTLSHYMEDTRPRDSATREHGRGMVRRRLPDDDWSPIPAPWTAISEGTPLDGVTSAEQLEVLINLMELLTLKD